jgi:hypothetical protein
MNGSKYLARAITPVWTEAKRTAATNLINNLRYHAGRINYFHKTWDPSFWDIKPIATTGSNLAKVWFLTNKDTLKTDFIYADTIAFKGTNISIEGEGYSFSFWGRTIPWLSDTSQEQILILQPNNTESQNYIIPLVKVLLESNKYSSSKKVSEWDWKKSNGTFSLNSTDGLTDIRANDKFELINVNMKATYPEGEKIPGIHPWYPGRTYCNVYASDLARWVLFPNTFVAEDNRSGNNNYAPWGGHYTAAKLHENITNNVNGHFKAVTFDEAWRYTNTGYVVYLTAYHHLYYEGKIGKYGKSGHIATCYQTIEYNEHEKAKLIQAGTSAGELAFNSVWSKNMINNHVKANLYLGYIIK